MLKPMLGLAATGVVAVLLWKLMAVILLPVLATLLGVVFLVLKIGLICAAIWFVIWLWRRGEGRVVE